MSVSVESQSSVTTVVGAIHQENWEEVSGGPGELCRRAGLRPGRYCQRARGHLGPLLGTWASADRSSHSPGVTTWWDSSCYRAAGLLLLPPRVHPSDSPSGANVPPCSVSLEKRNLRVLSGRCLAYLFWRLWKSC